MAAAAVVMATAMMTSPIVKYGCFNTMLEMTCINKHVLVFDSARYGRNDTMVCIGIFGLVSVSVFFGRLNLNISCGFCRM